MGQNIKNAVLTASFTRRNDTTAYAAEDVINNSTSSPSLLTFTSSDISLQGGQSFIAKTLRVITDSSTTTNASFRLYLLKSTQTAIADNSAQTLLYTNRSKRIGYIDFTLTSGGTGSDCAEAMVTDVNIPFKLSSGAIYGYLVAKAAYTPTSGQNFTFELLAHAIDS